MRLRGIVIASACAVLVAGAVLVIGCTSSVTQSLTGVSVQRGIPTTCVKTCNNDFAGFYATEQKLHLENVEKCQLKPQPDKNDCLVAEGIRHDAAKTKLGQDKIACQTNCPLKVSG